MTGPYILWLSACCLNYPPTKSIVENSTLQNETEPNHELIKILLAEKELAIWTRERALKRYKGRLGGWGWGWKNFTWWGHEQDPFVSFCCFQKPSFKPTVGPLRILQRWNLSTKITMQQKKISYSRDYSWVWRSEIQVRLFSRKINFVEQELQLGLKDSTGVTKKVTVVLTQSQVKQIQP